MIGLLEKSGGLQFVFPGNPLILKENLMVSRVVAVQIADVYDLVFRIVDG